MRHMKMMARIAVLPALATILLAGGCGGPGEISVDPEGGAKQKQARISAYGPAGIDTKKGSTVNPQAAARARANQGGR